MTVRLRGECKKEHKHSAECMTWYYDFGIRRKRYRGSLPECRTKPQAEQAELRLKQEVFEKRFGIVETGTMLFKDFWDGHYLPWAKEHKRSWRNDFYNEPVILEYFGAKKLCEVVPLDIERMKSQLLKTKTKHGTERSKASVNRVFEIVSRVFTLAIAWSQADFNPCAKVEKFELDNERFRWLQPEERPILLSVLDGRLKHLKPLVIISLATGLRKQELLKMKRNQVDFFKGIVTATKTKSGKNRDVPVTIFGPEAQQELARICFNKRHDDYLFVNPKTKQPYTDIKKGFHKACELAGIEGMVWHDLRATFGTALAEQGHHTILIAELMGHSDTKTTERYVRAAALRRKLSAVSSEQRHNHVTTAVSQAS